MAQLASSWAAESIHQGKAAAAHTKDLGGNRGACKKMCVFAVQMGGIYKALEELLFDSTVGAFKNQVGERMTRNIWDCSPVGSSLGAGSKHEEECSLIRFQEVGKCLKWNL